MVSGEPGAVQGIGAVKALGDRQQTDSIADYNAELIRKYKTVAISASFAFGVPALILFVLRKAIRESVVWLARLPRQIAKGLSRRMSALKGSLVAMIQKGQRDSKTLSEELNMLSLMYESGRLSEDEFVEAKRKLLS